MKVLHVIGSSSVGGAERHLLDLTAQQPERGVVPVVACPPDGALARALRGQGTQTVPWQVGGRLWPWTRSALKRCVLATRPDLVHAHMAKSAYLAGRVVPPLGIGLVATAHTLVKGQAFAAADGVICVSGAVRATLLARGYPAGRAVLIHNAVDTAKFHPPEDRSGLRQRLGIPEGACVLAQVGRLVPVKGHAHALAAVARLVARRVPAVLLIVGDGELRETLERTVRSRGIGDAVRFLGHQADVSPFLQAADLLLMPSLKEGFPLAVLEAMACGVVPVASRVGGLPEAIAEGENGFLVAVGDAEGMAEAVEAAWTAPDRLGHMARAAREAAVDRFGLTRQADAVAAVYRDVLAGRATPVGAGCAR